MPIDNPNGIDADAPLSFDDAVKAYAAQDEDEGAENGQPEAEQDAEDEANEPQEDADEASDGEEGQADEEEGEEPETDPAPAYVPPEGKVRLPDGSEATVAELIQGNLRDRDYRQKTMEAAELRRSVEARASEIQQFEQQLAQDREFTAQLLHSLMPQKPDPSMYAVDPLGYGEQKAFYDQRKEQLDYLLQQSQAAQQRAQQAQAEEAEQIRTREWEKTLEAMPELRDRNRLQAFASDVQRYGAEVGYSPQELKAIETDHRLAVVLRDAVSYRKLKANKPKAQAKVEGRPPVQRSGPRLNAETSRAREARLAMDRLSKTGSLRDGVKAILALEKG